jgi:arsenate reductase
MKKLLILCTGNSCRSQMAEGIARHLYGDLCDVYSAGTKPSFVHPKAIEMMKEINIDISNHTSKSATEFKNENIDLIITVCDNAKESCPVFLGPQKKLHWSFEDPAQADLEKFREVRDLICDKFESDLERYLK